ncbi:hypothetical protein T4E_178 [Trichinella pseudospiralis]|uniref:Uncharacterized protein n=1 Tax=Trichinella pseudospiralis TaxID=6337 RepID=A0A0V0XG95_TRIPS|nr:hypothetical protein T4E_178 [Trichinella pseudospiralis]
MLTHSRHTGDHPNGSDITTYQPTLGYARDKAVGEQGKRRFKRSDRRRVPYNSV